MDKRKVHFRNNSIIVPGHTKTRCGKVLRPIWNVTEHAYDTSGVVVTFNSGLQKVDVTVHATLVTCSKCLNKTRGIGIG